MTEKITPTVTTIERLRGLKKDQYAMVLVPVLIEEEEMVIVHVAPESGKGMFRQEDAGMVWREEEGTEEVNCESFLITMEEWVRLCEPDGVENNPEHTNFRRSGGKNNPPRERINPYDLSQVAEAMKTYLREGDRRRAENPYDCGVRRLSRRP